VATVAGRETHLCDSKQKENPRPLTREQGETAWVARDYVESHREEGYREKFP
jgi:hypothetical protein